MSWREFAQARERELLKIRDGFKAEKPSTENDASEPDVSGLAPELVEVWEKEGGVAENLATARGTAQRALDELEPDEQAGLTQSFDALPASAKTEVFKYIAIKPGNWRAADEAAVEAFRSMPEGASMPMRVQGSANSDVFCPTWYLPRHRNRWGLLSTALG